MLIYDDTDDGAVRGERDPIILLVNQAEYHESDDGVIEVRTYGISEDTLIVLPDVPLAQQVDTISERLDIDRDDLWAALAAQSSAADGNQIGAITPVCTWTAAGWQTTWGNAVQSCGAASMGAGSTMTYRWKVFSQSNGVGCMQARGWTMGPQGLLVSHWTNMGCQTSALSYSLKTVAWYQNLLSFPYIRTKIAAPPVGVTGDWGAPVYK